VGVGASRSGSGSVAATRPSRWGENGAVRVSNAPVADAEHGGPGTGSDAGLRAAAAAGANGYIGTATSLINCGARLGGSVSPYVMGLLAARVSFPVAFGFLLVGRR
jgi:hypothetical protein